MIELVRSTGLHEVVEIVPEGIVLDGHIQLVQIRLQRLPDPLGALPGLIGLDTGEAVAQNGSGRIEHPDNQHHRGQAGGP